MICLFMWVDLDPRVLDAWFSEWDSGICSRLEDTYYKFSNRLEMLATCISNLFLLFKRFFLRFLKVVFAKDPIYCKTEFALMRMVIEWH